MGMKKIIFIGGLGRHNEFGGELTKNKFIVKRLRELGWDVIAVDTAGARRNPLKVMTMPFKVWFNHDTPVIFSTCFANIRPFFKVISKIWPQRKYIYWVIGGNLSQRIENGPYKVNDFDCFNAILVEGHKMVGDLESLGIKNVKVVPNFKDTSLMPDISGKSIRKETTLKCVFFSRIIPSKGVEIILDTCRKLQSRDLNFTIDFYGEIASDYKADFMTAVNSLENVSYKGLLDFYSRDGYKKLSEYHLTLFPTFWEGEGFPGVIVDSYIAGVPVLASDWNFNGELIDSETGFLCRANDLNDFECTFGSILAHREDLTRYFKQCQHKAAGYDYKKVISNELINEILR